MIKNESERKVGTPRAKDTYRAYRRNHAIKWLGVEPDRYESPVVEKQVRTENSKTAKES